MPHNERRARKFRHGKGISDGTMMSGFYIDRLMAEFVSEIHGELEQLKTMWRRSRRARHLMMTGNNYQPNKEIR